MSSVIQRSLSGGELDPVLWARSDITKYQMGLRTLRNAFVRRNGGIQGRPGSTKVSQTKASGKVRLVPFIFSQGVTYVLELGNKYIRFYQNGLAMGVPSASAWASGTAYSMSQVVTSAGVTYICITGNSASNFANDSTNPAWGFNPLLYNTTLTTSTNQSPSTHGQAWYSLSGSVYEIPTPWAIADIPNLRFDQVANDIVFTHPSYPIMRLTRVPNFYSGGVDAFRLFAVQTGSDFLTQAVLAHNDQGDSNTFGPTASGAQTYAVVPVAANGDEYAALFYQGSFGEVVGGNLTTTKTVSTSSAPVKVEWTAISNAVTYNVYKMSVNMVFGYLGNVQTNFFYDYGGTPDFNNPWVQDNATIFGWSQIDAFNAPWNASNIFPTAVAFYQQRTTYGGTNNNPTRVYASQTGLYDNFNVNVPSLATDSLNFTMSGQQDAIQHLLSLNTLLVFTYGTINSVDGDGSGGLSPSTINPHRQTIHGCSNLRPLIVGEFCLYNQAQGSVVRDLGFNFQVDGYKGDDLTSFATHLFDNYTLADWAYQSIPHSVVWVVRSDGTLLSLTYVREQAILGWAHHDTQAGFYENVCCIPEGNQVSVYVVANRTINGTATRFIERLYNQQFTDVRNYVGMDCATTIDGRNTTTDTISLTGGTNWNETELLTATLSANNFLTFTSAMATNNDYLFIYDSSGNLYRFKITVYSSATVVQGFVDRQLPASLQNPLVATATWSHATAIVTGVSYLNGQNVSVFGDGDVVGSPNNQAYSVYTVSGGSITLDKAYAVIQVGLPFVTDVETLDIDVPGAMDNLGSRHKFVGEVTIYTVNSRSVFVGAQNPDTDLTNATLSPTYRLTEQKLRQFENYDSPMNLQTGKNTQTIQGQWDQKGHVFIRNVDPTPLTISAISPEGLFPMRTG